MFALLQRFLEMDKVYRSKKWEHSNRNGKTRQVEPDIVTIIRF